MASLSSERQITYSHTVSETIAAVPSSATDLTTTDTRLWQISVANTTAGALTFVVLDKQTTPRTVIPTVSIAANTAYIISWPEGVFCSSGINWAASATGLEASVIASYK